MKKHFILSLLAFLLISCASVSELIPNTTDRQRVAPQATQVYSTSTPYPTATIGYQQTAIVAQQTADEAVKMLIQETAAESARQQERLSWTATVDMATIVSAGLTAQSDIATSTAALTAVPLTSTAQALDREIAKTEISDSHTAVVMTKQAPTQIVLVAQAQAEAKYAETNMLVGIGVRVAVAFFVFALAGTMIFVILRRESKPEPAVVSIPRLDDDIPLKRHDDDGSVRFTRADVPCTKDQLIDLADGIINRGMTLAFNAWEGTPVHKVLKAMREFMVENHFAKLVKGQGGALDLQADGEQFLRETLDKQEPPAPFRCLPDIA